LVEAPRGLLIHHHEIKEGLVHHVDIITPTAQNAEDIERYCYIAAQKLLDDSAKDDQIRDRMDLVVRAFDPCISCSAHMAEVKKAPSDDWKIKINEIMKKGSPIFVGIGNPDKSDDGAGVRIALELKKRENIDVLLESEIYEDENKWKDETDRPFIFLDVVDFGQTTGKVTLLPMNYVLNNASLSHRFLPIFSGLMTYKQLKNAFMLGIQPESVENGGRLSAPVRKAMHAVLAEIVT
jgi:hydrogenase maturation protease